MRMLVPILLCLWWRCLGLVMDLCRGRRLVLGMFRLVLLFRFRGFGVVFVLSMLIDFSNASACVVLFI